MPNMNHAFDGLFSFSAHQFNVNPINIKSVTSLQVQAQSRIRILSDF